MYKVLALDLDGTVLRNDHRIHTKVKEAILAAQKHLHVVIVTGRHHTAARPYYKELSLNTPIICCNGTYTYDYQNEKVLSHNAIEKNVALDFINLANEHNAKMVMYVTDAMLYSKHNSIDYMQALENWAKSIDQSIRPNIYKVDSIEAEAKAHQYLWKFVVEAKPEAIEKMLIHPLIEKSFSSERSWFNRIDFAAKGNTKGTALAAYLAQNDFSSSETIAVGDNHNDISMLKLAGLGVAMANADETVKANAQKICETDNNEDGLARLIYEQIKGKNQ